MPGVNKALKSSGFSSFYESSNSSRHCVFLAHISIDKNAAIAIGDQFLENDIDIYLDKNDEGLQDAVRRGDSKKITEFIQTGIDKSTHLMCILSEDTKSSWWVPFEIGYGKKGVKNICSLSLKDVSGLPPYLVIVENIDGIANLEKYINKLRGISMFSESIGRSSKPNLSRYLKQ